jgi:hypothetical protein
VQNTSVRPSVVMLGYVATDIIALIPAPGVGRFRTPNPVITINDGRRSDVIVTGASVSPNYSINASITSLTFLLSSNKRTNCHGFIITYVKTFRCYMFRPYPPIIGRNVCPYCAKQLHNNTWSISQADLPADLPRHL